MINVQVKPYRVTIDLTITSGNEVSAQAVAQQIVEYAALHPRIDQITAATVQVSDQASPNSIPPELRA